MKRFTILPISLLLVEAVAGEQSVVFEVDSRTIITQINDIVADKFLDSATHRIKIPRWRVPVVTSKTSRMSVM